MIIFNKNLDDELVIVAEIGVNHEGSVRKAQGLIKALASTGVDAIKLQSYTPDRYISPIDSARFQRASQFALSRDEHDQLFSLASDLGVNLFSSALSEDWVPYLATKSSVLKVASGDITFKPTIQTGAKLFDQMIISTGASTVEEIDQAVQWVAELSPVPLREKLVLLHCVSAYPAPVEEANLGAIRFLQERYGVAVGFSSHFLEEFVPIAAVAAGASVIEIHVTDQKSDREFRDHALSWEPGDIPELVSRLRSIHVACCDKSKNLQPSEAMNRESICKVALANRNLPGGHRLTESDFRFARAPVPHARYAVEDLKGQTLATEVSVESVINPSDLLTPQCR